jgi:hypothetical protein
MPEVPATTLGLGKKGTVKPQGTVAGQTSSILAGLKAKQALAKK